MPWWAWLCLGIFGVLAIAGSAVLLTALIPLGRASSRFRESVEPLAAELERSSALLQQRSDAMATRQAAFRESQARAQASYHGLLALWGALQEVRTGLRIVRFVLARR